MRGYIDFFTDTCNMQDSFKKDCISLLTSGKVKNWPVSDPALDSGAEDAICDLILNNRFDELAQLDGEFSYVIYNSKERELFIITSRTGVHPVYVYRSNDMVIFSDEPSYFKSITSMSPDLGTVLFFLKYEYIPEGRSFISDVQLLEPGYIYRINRYEMRANTLERSYCDQDTNVKQALLSSVSKCSKETVLMYSGGIDSAILLSAFNSLSMPVETLSIRFSSEQLDEGSFQNLSDKECHSEVRLEPGMFRSSVDELIRSDAYGIHSLSQDVPAFVAALNGFKGRPVCFGLPADELFFGYPYMVETALNCFRLAALEHSLPNGLPEPVFFNGSIIRHLLEELYATPVQHCDYLPAVYEEGEAEQLVNAELPGCCSFASDDIVKNMIRFQLNRLLPRNQYLKLRTICNLAGCSLVLPFSDPLIAEIALSLSFNDHCLPHISKPALVRNFYPDIPEQIATRSKQGFMLPLREWMKDELSLIAEYTLDNCSVLSKNKDVCVRFFSDASSSYSSAEKAFRLFSAVLMVKKLT